MPEACQPHRVGKPSQINLLARLRGDAAGPLGRNCPALTMP
jgi:hypothetical protein